MSVINTNMSAIVATNAIITNDRAQEVAMERLSTGLRINSASDDAAGLAISSRMEAEVSGLNMATRNTNDAISMIETIEGSSREIGAALQRMRELAVQATSDTYGVTDRAALDMEFGQLMAEMTRIATQTTWNEITVLDGGDTTAVSTSAVTSSSLTIQVGKSADQSMALTIKSFDPRTSVRAAARLERVNPQTGAILGARAATAGGLIELQAHNLFTDSTNTVVSGGANRVRTADNVAGADGSGFATLAIQTVATTTGGLIGAGNDNHHLANTAIAVAPATAGAGNRRDAETQAFGSAVLYVGNNLDSGSIGAGVFGAAVDADAPWSATMQQLERINILSRTNADYALYNLDIAISAVSAERAKYGSYMSRLEHAGDNMTNVSRHVEQSRSRIADADYAVETSELSRTTIIAQASTAMLAQANAAKQTVLTLLQ
jgi:flagellin